ncbi:hypothetical protein [Trichococcus shcherbakoviae]
MKKRFYAILIQSHLRHRDWCLSDCGMWTEETARRRLHGAAVNWGLRHVMLTGCESEAMRTAYKPPKVRGKKANSTAEQTTEEEITEHTEEKNDSGCP